MDKIDAIIISYLRIIYDISDFENYFLNSLKPDATYIGSYDEIICTFLSGNESIINNRNEYRLTTEEHFALVNIINAVDRYNWNNPGASEETVIVDPEWRKIQEMARDVMRIFNYDPNKKENIVEGLLDVISVMGDIEGQKKAWLERSLPDFIDAESLLLYFFHDYKAKDVVENSKEYGLSQEQYKELQTLYNHIMILNSQIDEYRGHFEKPFVISSREIYNLPEWQAIQKLSQEVLKAFKYVSK